MRREESTGHKKGGGGGGRGKCGKKSAPRIPVIRDLHSAAPFNSSFQILGF